MIQWTTPTHTHIVRGIDLSGYDVYVSYKQGRNELSVASDQVEYDGSDTTVTVGLSQRQTGGFKAGAVKVQVNWVTPDSKRDAVLVKSVEVDENLMAKEVKYVGA